jgi:hypothetical protein
VHSHILLSIPGQLVSLVDSSFVLFTNPISFDSGFDQKKVSTHSRRHPWEIRKK